MSVKLRKRKLPSGKIQLFLDIDGYGSRKCETLSSRCDRLQNPETLKMAEQVRAKREIELQTQLHDVTGAKNKKGNFAQYAAGLAARYDEPNTRQSWENAVQHLKQFEGENIFFADLNRAFFEKFLDYLKKQDSRPTLRRYTSL
jgi:hypothetical protein